MKHASDPEQLERWNGRFSGADGYLFGKRPNAFLASQRERLRPGMRALSVADGEGRNSVWLARQGLAVTAFDFSPVAVAKARSLAAEAGVEVDFHVCDIFGWDWDSARYDAIVGIFFQFLTPPQRADVFAAMQRALAPGGLLLIQGYQPEQLENKTGGPHQEDRFYTQALLRESFAGLEILHLRSHDEVIDEGTAHRGMSALIDLVAWKPG